MNQGSGDDEGFAALFEKAGAQGVRQRRMSVGDEVEGVVVKVGRDEVFLDLDGKREAFVERIALVGGDGTPLELNVIIKADVQGSLEPILGELEKLGQGEIVINDDICNQEYRFGPEVVELLFAPAPRTLH